MTAWWSRGPRSFGWAGARTSTRADAWAWSRRIISLLRCSSRTSSLSRSTCKSSSQASAAPADPWAPDGAERSQPKAG